MLGSCASCACGTLMLNCDQSTTPWSTGSTASVTSTGMQPCRIESSARADQPSPYCSMHTHIYHTSHVTHSSLFAESSHVPPDAQTARPNYVFACVPQGAVRHDGYNTGCNKRCNVGSASNLPGGLRQMLKCTAFCSCLLASCADCTAAGCCCYDDCTHHDQ